MKLNVQINSCCYASQITLNKTIKDKKNKLIAQTSEIIWNISK
jgi:hypothetical protein